MPGGVRGPNPASRRTLIVLALVLAPLALATVVGMVLLWHGQADQLAPGTANPEPARVVTHSEATVLTTRPYECPAINQRPGPNNPPRTVTCASVDVLLETGRDQGEQVSVDVPAESYRAGMQAGDRIRLTRVFNHLAGPPTYGFYDYARQPRSIASNIASSGRSWTTPETSSRCAAPARSDRRIPPLPPHQAHLSEGRILHLMGASRKQFRSNGMNDVTAAAIRRPRSAGDLQFSPI
ncbi:hypothetical protein [Acrocarpospora sp. B8E8]|uniref:hypothetical protein n=1 Tax=Acrocarpospora sp. B8E8 TaxID=3153572 RepID=UPI00325FA587